MKKIFILLIFLFISSLFYIDNKLPKGNLSIFQVSKQEDIIRKDFNKLFVKGETNLEKFYKITRFDPLFYSPFLDTEALGESIQRLQEKETELFEVILKDLKNKKDPRFSAYKKMFSDSILFPYEFLENLAKINELSEEFFQKPSRELAEKLIESYKSAAETYEKSINDKISFLNKEVKKYKKYDYFFFLDSATSLGVIESDFWLIKKNAEFLKKEIERRKSCLDDGSNCYIKTEYTTPSLFFLAFQKNFFDDYNILNEDFLLVPDYTKRKGPYKIDSDCWGGENDLLYLYFLDHQDFKGIIPKLATNNYYNDVYSWKERNSYFGFLYSLGYEFVRQLETTVYGCTDLEFYSQITSLDLFLEKLRNEKNANNYPFNFSSSFGIKSADGLSLKSIKLFLEARLVEDKLISDKYPDYDDFKKLGEIYSAIIKDDLHETDTEPIHGTDTEQNGVIPIPSDSKGEESRDSSAIFPPQNDGQNISQISGQISKNSRETILQYKLLIENQFSLLPLIINEISFQLDFLKLSQLFNKTILDLGQILVSRSNYSIFYFPFSHSVWRILETPNYILEKEKTPDFNRKFVSINELQKKGYKIKEIKNFYVNSYRFLSSLVDKRSNIIEFVAKKFDNE